MNCPHGHGVLAEVGNFWICGQCGYSVSNCPRNHGPMTPVGQFLICGTCGYKSDISFEPNAAKANAAPAILQQLPSIVAIPAWEYYSEAHPVMRLHRLCDTVEMITRFCTIVMLGEWRAQTALLKCLIDSLM